MPCFRGIELSVVEASDHSVLPEFPHPDGSSIRLGGLQSSRYSDASFLSPWGQKKTSGRLCNDAQKCADPKISVYIPSIPDTNLYFRYVIAQAPIGHEFFFFRVTINGRQVVSWGVDLSETLEGAVHQALFEPSTHYQYSDRGIVMTQFGIESRCFRFVTFGSSGSSIANDGGLIEIQAFRAKSRVRRAPQPDFYRGGGDKYGISLISNGLIENPHMANYYVYHLLDPKDSPYASFCFHYRSWENLRLLQLAPVDKPGFLGEISKSPSMGLRERSDSSGFDLSSVFRRSQICTAKADGHGVETSRANALHEQVLHQQDTLFTYPFSSTDVSSISLPRKERPLPALPLNRKTSCGPEGDAKIEYKNCVAHEDTGDNKGKHAVICKNNIDAEEVKSINQPLESPVKSNAFAATLLQNYDDSKDNQHVDALHLDPAVEVEAAADMISSKKSLKDCLGKRHPDPEGTMISNANCSVHKEQNDHLPAKLSAMPLIKYRAEPRTIYIAPFTDSLCKHEMIAISPLPTRRHIRSVSHETSSESRASNRKIWHHGGSFDSQYHSALIRNPLDAREENGSAGRCRVGF